MSIINGTVPMHEKHEEPSTPSKDPLSSPAVHIQWQNSQSACAAMEELRAASSLPRRPPKRLTFDFELPASTAGPSSSSFTTTTTPSDPFLPSRARSVRSRALAHVQSHSQNDVPAVPSADASKFLDMLGRASARVDENSRKRMRAARTLRPPLKGKERVRAAAGTRSLDELHDHTNLLRVASEHRAGTSGAHYSSLPVMPPKVLPSQTVSGATLTDADANEIPIMDVEPDECGGTVDDMGDPGSTRARNETQHFPPRSSTTGHAQGPAEPPSPTPVRPAPITRNPPPQPAGPPKSAAVPPSLAPLASQHSVPTPTRPPTKSAAAGAATRKGAGGLVVPMTPESLPRRGASAFTPTITASQLSLSSSQGPRRALGMRRTAAPTPASSSNVQHSAAVKRPFRPPRTQVPTKSQAQQQWQQNEAKSPGVSDPDSSFDLAFDFDPDALEAAMRPYD